MSCGVDHRHSSDPRLLWLWCRLVATAPIGPLAWEPAYAAGAALEKAKRQKKKNAEIGNLFQLYLVLFCFTDDSKLQKVKVTAFLALHSSSFLLL